MLTASERAVAMRSDSSARPEDTSFRTRPVKRKRAVQFSSGLLEAVRVMLESSAPLGSSTDTRSSRTRAHHRLWFFDLVGGCVVAPVLVGRHQIKFFEHSVEIVCRMETRQFHNLRNGEFGILQIAAGTLYLKLLDDLGVGFSRKLVNHPGQMSCRIVKPFRDRFQRDVGSVFVDVGENTDNCLGIFLIFQNF